MKIIPTIVIILIAFFCGFQHVDGATPKKKKTPDANEVLNNAITAFYNYDFEEADELFSEYRSLKAKAKQEPDEELLEWEKRLEVASGALESVQKIVIIDSITVGRDSFLKYFKLSPSSGKIGKSKDFKAKDLDQNENMAFLSEHGNYMISAAPDRFGELKITETFRLLDGEVETFEIEGESFGMEGNFNYPFMGGDGETLYFANDGEDSMGGYDIFVAQRDPFSVDFRQPLNIGMPFNSPYDDFMMAIDEETGVGWWATDRNDPGGDVTLYVYLLEEVRKNYPSDTENLEDLAKISNYKATWEGEDSTKFDEIKRKIEKY